MYITPPHLPKDPSPPSRCLLFFGLEEVSQGFSLTFLFWCPAGGQAFMGIFFLQPLPLPSMYGISTYIYHILPLKTTKCRKIFHTWMLWTISSMIGKLLP